MKSLVKEAFQNGRVWAFKNFLLHKRTMAKIVKVNFSELLKLTKCLQQSGELFVFPKEYNWMLVRTLWIFNLPYAYACLSRSVVTLKANTLTTNYVHQHPAGYWEGQDRFRVL